MYFPESWVKLALKVLLSRTAVSLPIYRKSCITNRLKEALADFPLPDTQIEYNYVEAEDKDWNEEWEKNFFQPIVIGDRCVIHSTFHNDVPQAEYDIVINPQMAFGTGHHETTSLIIGELLDSDLQGKSLLDMGCGTSILAILARMRGASPCTAIDIDEWCVRNSLENIELNGVDILPYPKAMPPLWKAKVLLIWLSPTSTAISSWQI